MKRNFERGRFTPAWENRPELFEELTEVWEAFHELSSCRTPSAMGIAPISLVEINAWLELNEFGSRRNFYKLIITMDSSYRSQVSGRQQEK